MLESQKTKHSHKKKILKWILAEWINKTHGNASEMNSHSPSYYV